MHLATSDAAAQVAPGFGIPGRLLLQLLEVPETQRDTAAEPHGELWAVALAVKDVVISHVAL